MTETAGLAPAQAKVGMLRAVTIIALVTLPFMTALTINVGFPLKIYEVALLAAMVLVPLSGRLSFPRRAVSGVALTAAWMAVAGMILMFRLILPLDTVDSVGLASRFGPVGDGVTKFVYLLLDLFAFILFARFAARDEKGFLKYWMVGAALAAGYSYYIFTANLVGIIKPPLLPSANTAQTLVAGRLFIRCATFREGNEAGLYFAISALLAFHGGYRKTAWFLLGAIITTFSTLALIVLGGTMLWQVWRYVGSFSARLRVLLLPAILAVGLAVGGGLAATAVFQSVVVGKLTSQEGPEAFSRVERLVFARAAWDMFLDHPVLGVGIAQFGYNFPHYSSYPVSGKPVPNVVYLEFLSEDGLIVFAIFLVFFYVGFRRTSGHAIYLRAAFLSITLSFFAYATISVMFIWALFGLLFGRDPASADASDVRGA
jgi:hypothetical protein